MNPVNHISLQKKWIIIPFLFLYLLIVFISAWLCDDSYITFRTVDNFINGYGLTWNINERVQAYTHPLWMFLLSFFYFLTGEPFFTSIILSIVLSLFTIYILAFKISSEFYSIILVLIALIFSKAFVDYSTSGLENPFSHLIIVLYFFIYLKKENDNKKLFYLALTVSAATLNRMDLILLLLPPLIFTAVKTEKFKSIKFIIAGFTPLVLWLLFSLFYYGFPFPNTAYAKLNHGISNVELIEQGLYYFLNSFYLDPLTLPVILLGLVIPFFIKRKFLFPITIGLILYLLYIIKIGGDFMSGRYFSVPFLVSLIILSQIVIKKKVFLSGIILIIILGLMSPYPTILYGADYGLGPKIVKGFKVGPRIFATFDNGIADERLFYYQFTGILNYNKLEKHQWIKKALKIKNEKQTPFVYTIAGIFGYYAGPDIHIIDPWALGDPLLSKLPATGYWRAGYKHPPGRKWWRIGHFARKIPAGYIETISSNENVIENESLRKYYNKLSYVIKGDLFDFNRLIEIWNLNTGKYNYLIER